MGRRGNPYDNAKAESFMKTLQVAAVYPMVFETFADVDEAFRVSWRRSTTVDGFTQPSAISAPRTSRISTPGQRPNQRPEIVRPEGPTPVRGQNCLPIHTGRSGKLCHHKKSGRLAEIRQDSYAPPKTSSLPTRSVHPTSNISQLLNSARITVERIHASVVVELHACAPD